MTFGEEIINILSDISVDYQRTLRGWFFYEPGNHIPIAEVAIGGKGWGFYCDSSNGEWEWFEKMEECQDRCREWANGVRCVIQENGEKVAWGSP